MGDMIALQAEPISIGGRNYTAYVERGATEQEASEFGIDDFTDEYRAGIISDRAPQFAETVIYKSQTFRITEVENSGANIYTITFTADEYRA